jgi:hypothetical protein
VSAPPNVEYKVLLTFPGFGDEREHAEQMVEEALHFLNTQKDEPGMRFAPNVSAHLEIVTDTDQARAALEADDDLAMMILHDLDDEDRDALTRECADREVLVCHTLEGEPKPRRRGARHEGWKIVFRKAKRDEPRAHRILACTLTDPTDGDQEELADRVGQIIALLALGVMEHHWRRHHPDYGVSS